jgi:hypothetical protein
MSNQGPSGSRLLARIFAWREAGWSFEQIGAQLKAEGWM